MTDVILDCPRCYNGTDPRLKDQSCLICWGNMTFNLTNENWNGQHRKVMEHLLGHPNWEKVKDELRGTR